MIKLKSKVTRKTYNEKLFRYFIYFLHNMDIINLNLKEIELIKELLLSTIWMEFDTNQQSNNLTYFNSRLLAFVKTHFQTFLCTFGFKYHFEHSFI